MYVFYGSNDARIEELDFQSYVNRRLSSLTCPLKSKLSNTIQRPGKLGFGRGGVALWVYGTVTHRSEGGSTDRN